MAKEVGRMATELNILYYTLQSEIKYLEELIEKGAPENKLMRETLVKHSKEELERVGRELYKECYHDWVTDMIDVSIFQQKQVIYCNNCGLDKI